MGMNSRITKHFPRVLESMGIKSWQGVKMLEYGNQIYRGKNAPFKTAKEYFESLGVFHVSVDKNGKDGALPLDLTQPLQGIGEPFDIVTNFETTEHVKHGQYQPFKTMHDMIRPGGMMVSVVPETGFLAKHSYFHYTKEFFRDLAILNYYKIHLLQSEAHFKVERNLVIFIAEKVTDLDFIDEKSFDITFKHVEVMK